MADEKYAIKYKVESLDYNFGTASDEPHIALTLKDFKFGEGNNSHVIGYNGVAIWLYLNKSTFSKLTGRFWDGTPEGVKELKKDLEGKIFSLDLNLNMTKEREIK